MLLIFAMLLATAQPDAGLELHIAAGGAVTESRVIGQPESALLFCVKDVVSRMEGSAFASARRDTTLLIPLGLEPADAPHLAKKASKSRLALPWEFVQELANCRGFDLLRNRTDDCVDQAVFSQGSCRAPVWASVALTVRSDGSVKSVRVAPYVSNGPEIRGASCLERAAMRWRFPEFAGIAYQVGARVLLAPGTPCSDPVLRNPPAPVPASTSASASAPAQSAPRRRLFAPVAVVIALIIASTAIAMTLLRRRKG